MLETHNKSITIMITIEIKSKNKNPAGSHQRGSTKSGRLTFAVLEAFARPRLAVFLALAHTRISR